MATSRRELLLRGLFASGAAVAGTTVNGCVRWVDPAPVVEVNPPVNGKLRLSVADFPALAPPGSAITVRARSLDDRILVVHWPDDTYGALQSECTHASCPLGFFEGEVECPCHGSRFDAGGQVTNPPAVQGLEVYPATFNAGTGVLEIELFAGTSGFPALVGGEVYFPFADFPQLQTAGQAVIGTPQGMNTPIVVIALAAGGHAALSARCTHLNCTVGWSAPQNELVCPCHGSAFATDGTVTHQPAVRPLPTYTAAADASGVRVSGL